MKKIFLILLLFATGCQTPPEKRPTTLDQINDEMAQAVRASAKPAAPDAVSQALLPPLKIEMPKARFVESKFDLVVNNAPASQVFLGIVSGTRYSMLVHPEVAGAITVNLKDVTVIEALEAIRELYGYDYKLDGPRIFVQPLTLQTRVFQVNYLTSLRKGHQKLMSPRARLVIAHPAPAPPLVRRLHPPRPPPRCRAARFRRLPPAISGQN